MLEVNNSRSAPNEGEEPCPLARDRLRLLDCGTAGLEVILVRLTADTDAVDINPGRGVVAPDLELERESRSPPSAVPLVDKENDTVVVEIE